MVVQSDPLPPVGLSQDAVELERAGIDVTASQMMDAVGTDGYGIRFEPTIGADD